MCDIDSRHLTLHGMEYTVSIPKWIILSKAEDKIWDVHFSGPTKTEQWWEPVILRGKTVGHWRMTCWISIKSQLIE